MDGPDRYRFLLVALLLAAFPLTSDATEPPVAEVRRQALRYNDLDRRLDRWSARARWRHLLPEVTARVGGLDQADESIDFYEFLSRDSEGELLFDAARTRNGHDTRDRLTWEIRASIDFRGLIFDSAELQAAREARIRSAERRDLIEAVHDAYFRRLALLDRLRRAEPKQRRRIAADVVLLEARLDGLTGGWYSARLRRGDR
jgi:hypothetical protein